MKIRSRCVGLWVVLLLAGSPPAGPRARGRLNDGAGAAGVVEARPAQPPSGQVSEEEMVRAFDLLGQMLGLSEVSPEELKGRVEELGGLRFLREVPFDFMTREDLRSYIRGLFDAEYSPEVASREERMLGALGFLESGQDLRAIREGVLNESIAGFYDERPGVKKLVAISSGVKLGLMIQLVLAHELRHALQDQHVDLRRVLGEVSDYDDRKLAALSLLEGDATLLMEKYLGSGGAPGLEEMFGGLTAEGMDARGLAEMFAGPALRQAPPIVREQLVAPYLEGRRLAAELYRRGGFELLNRRLADPPLSSEQVLHPEKYIDGVDRPMDVGRIETGGITPESEGRVGELYIRVLLEPVLPREEAHLAAAGWGGDRYALWVDARGRYHLLWRTLWDTESDAKEFFAGLSRLAPARFGSPTRAAGTVELEGTDGSWTLIEHQGREVVLRREGF